MSGDFPDTGGPPSPHEGLEDARRNRDSFGGGRGTSPYKRLYSVHPKLPETHVDTSESNGSRRSGSPVAVRGVLYSRVFYVRHGS